MPSLWAIYSAWTNFVFPLPSEWDLAYARDWSAVMAGFSTPQASMAFLVAWMLVSLCVIPDTQEELGPGKHFYLGTIWIVQTWDLTTSPWAPGCKADALSGMSHLATHLFLLISWELKSERDPQFLRTSGTRSGNTVICLPTTFSTL